MIGVSQSLAVGKYLEVVAVGEQVLIALVAREPVSLVLGVSESIVQLSTTAEAI